MSKSLSTVLSKVSHTYLEGAVEFYAKLNPDPWQEAHDRLEKEMLTAFEIKEEDLRDRSTSSAISVFEESIGNLLNSFRPFSLGARGSSATRGFYSNSPEQCDVRASIAEKSCAGCATKEKIKIKQHPIHGVVISCERCWTEKYGQGKK